MGEVSKIDITIYDLMVKYNLKSHGYDIINIKKGTHKGWTIKED